MNKMKIHAAMIEKGVVDNGDTVVIKGRGNYVYINVLTGLDVFQCYYYSNGELTFAKGEDISPKVIEIMKEIEVE